MKPVKNILSTIVILFLIILSLFTLYLFNGKACNFFRKNKDNIHIAVVAPQKSAAGKSHIQGIQLYVDRINKKGGIKDRKIILDIYDDANDKTTAREKALEIVHKKRAVAVIGHISSAISISGGAVYKQHKIPAVTPSSTSDKLTMENKWYFRTVFNNSSQGKFLAYYVKNILKKTSIYIIREDEEHSSGIAEVFKKEAKEINLPVNYDKAFRAKDPNLDSCLKQMVYNIKKNLEQNSAIFVGTHAREGIKIIKLIREAGIENPVIGPTAFATQNFKQGFDQYPLEKAEPGYYTNGLYMGVPLIYDTANETAQIFKKRYWGKYRETPDWQAAYAYDTAMVIVQAILKTGVTGQPETIENDRIKLRDYLASMTLINDAVAGTTGLNYFDKNGDCPKPITIGIYRHKNITSAQAQLQPVLNSRLIPDIGAALDKGYILPYKKGYIYKTNVVYVGLEMGSIDELNLKKNTALLDFHIWFRYQGEFDAQDIIFLNAIENIRMPPPDSSKKTALTPGKSEDKITATFIKKEEKAGLTSLLYHVRANFRNDFDSDRQVTEEYRQLGFKFRHRNLSRSNLIYVTDIVGMKLTDKSGFVEKMKMDAVLSPEYDWKLDDAHFFLNNALKNSRGDLRYLDLQNKFIECSQFNMEIIIKEDRFSLRRKFSGGVALWLTAISFLVLSMLVISQFQTTFSRFAKSIWFFQALFVFLLLLSAEIVLLSKMAGDPGIQNLKYAILTFDILWWIVPAIFIQLGLNTFIHKPIEKQTGQATPKVMRLIPVYIIYLTTVYGIVTFVFDQNITHLMTTSGVVAVTVGFLIKDNISKLFDSISIIKAYEIKTGQWIQICGFDEGMVEDITKLSTRIRTREGSLLNIPNSVVLSSAIRNYGYKDDVYWQNFKLETVTSKSPEQIMKVLKTAILEPDEILKIPEPMIIFEGQGDSSAIYTVRYAVKDYSKKNEHLTMAWSSVWLHLSKANIELATPHRIIKLAEQISTKTHISA
ncbi:ABC transporter substrate-binding protein [Desulfobacula phenolica]|uniref:Branched-chain amino acid transport system substrate-binding protein n=1 Tax=Desulfobacula phenolica TaxID=90732 RepID=A0A1H2JQQ1_9BACT|nr:ABC transporter substrate-binding protein [Desulfobacula phenolica]SDU58488.1 branched-chain amino acid transport system substrate-binding protein [Desulfobacula phenolica]